MNPEKLENKEYIGYIFSSLYLFNTFEYYNAFNVTDMEGTFPQNSPITHLNFHWKPNPDLLTPNG